MLILQKGGHVFLRQVAVVQTGTESYEPELKLFKWFLLKNFRVHITLYLAFWNELSVLKGKTTMIYLV